MAEMTVTQHLAASQKEWPAEDIGLFTDLLHELVLSAKLIARQISQAGLSDVLGGTGEINIQGEKVQKLDEFANQTITRRMMACGSVCALGSEEMAEMLFLDHGSTASPYLIFFDPLDGSSNIDCNICIGTIFSIFRRPLGTGDRLEAGRILLPGLEQVAAGYFLYGASTIMVYTTGCGVSAFTLDPSIGEFLLSHPNIQMPKAGSIYSVNASYYQDWSPRTRAVVDAFSRPCAGTPHSLRYVGSLVADFHRTLMYGGIFMYPEQTGKPDGKLRLLYEAAPMAFLAEQAGGMATDGWRPIMEKIPAQLHQRTPLFIGSLDDVNRVTEIYRNFTNNDQAG